MSNFYTFLFGNCQNCECLKGWLIYRLMLHRIKWEEDMVKGKEDEETENKCALIWEVCYHIREMLKNMVGLSFRFRLSLSC